MVKRRRNPEEGSALPLLLGAGVLVGLFIMASGESNGGGGGSRPPVPVPPQSKQPGGGGGTTPGGGGGTTPGGGGGTTPGGGGGTTPGGGGGTTPPKTDGSNNPNDIENDPLLYQTLLALVNHYTQPGELGNFGIYGSGDCDGKWGTRSQNAWNTYAKLTNTSGGKDTWDALGYETKDNVTNADNVKAFQKNVGSVPSKNIFGQKLAQLAKNAVGKPVGAAETVAKAVSDLIGDAAEALGKERPFKEVNDNSWMLREASANSNTTVYFDYYGYDSYPLAVQSIKPGCLIVFQNKCPLNNGLIIATSTVSNGSFDAVVYSTYGTTSQKEVVPQLQKVSLRELEGFATKYDCGQGGKCSCFITFRIRDY